MTTATAVAGGTGRRAPSSSALYWRYWSASTVSQAGDAVTAVALPLTAVVALHSSALQVSLITAAGYLAWLLIGLPAGVLVQRLPLRGTQVAMDLGRAAAIASVPLAAALGVLSLAQLLVVALVTGLANVVFGVANSTFLPAIVGKDQLTARNSLNSATQAVTQLGGPSIGGVLVQLLGAAAALVVDAVSYLASAAVLRTLPPVDQPGGRDRPGTLREQVREGWRYTTRHPVVGRCTAGATAVNFVCGALLAITPVFLVRTLHAPPALVGVLIATEGVGSLLGASLTPRLTGRIGSAVALRRAALVAAAFALLLPLARPGWGLAVFALGNAGFAGGVVVLSITTRTARQACVPPELFPRVMATVRFLSWGAIPLGALVAGTASTLYGTRAALWLIALLGFASPLALLTGRVRRMRDLTWTD